MVSSSSRAESPNLEWSPPDASQRAAAARRKTQACPDPRPDLGFRGQPCDQRQLTGLFYHQDNGQAHGAAQQGRLDVFLILVSVANDQGFLVFQHRQNGQQFRLRACLETVVVRLSQSAQLLPRPAAAG